MIESLVDKLEKELDREFPVEIRTLPDGNYALSTCGIDFTFSQHPPYKVAKKGWIIGNVTNEEFTNAEKTWKNEALVRRIKGEDETITAEDGGPGSGNWGHKGRPGLVGGSGPGGGKMYRGGRSDIGYFGSRKDWLNGLTGERQKEASEYMRDNEKYKNEDFRKKEVIEDLFKRGMITNAEANKRLKEGNLDKLKPGMTTEEYIVAMRDPLLMNLYAGEARNWKDNKERLIKENLSDDEQKVINWIIEDVEDFNNFPPYVSPAYENLKAKALGLVKEIEPMPEEMLYLAGIKKANGDVKLDWYKPSSERSGMNRMMESDMNRTIGDPRPETDPLFRKLTKEEFSHLTQRFVDTLKYKDFSKSELYSPRSALSNMKSAFGLENEKNYESALSDEDKEMIRKAARMFLPNSKQEGPITGEYLNEIQRWASWSPLRKKEERRTLQDFLIAETKMMTGISPKSQEESEIYKKLEEEKAQKKKEKAEAKKAAEELSKRYEESKKEDQRRYDEGVKTGDPMVSYPKDSNLNIEHLNDVTNGVNPNYSESSRNGDRRYTCNCQRCVIAFVARLRGYNVEAKPRIRLGRGERDPFHRLGGETIMFKGAAWDKTPGDTGDEQNKNIEKQLKDWGNGAVAMVRVAWARSNSAHVFIAMNDGGVVKWIDPQNPKADASKYISNGRSQAWYTSVSRVDDKPFSDLVHMAIRPVGGKYDDHFYDPEFC